MAYSSNNTERSLAITRVIMIYVILLLCSLVPVYYLLNIPDISHLNVGSTEKKEMLNEEKIIEDFKRRMSELDILLGNNKFNTDYRTGIDDLNRITKNDVDTTNMYWPLFKKIVILYEKVNDVNENSSYKIDLNKLQNDFNELKAKKEDVEKELEDCKKSKNG